MVPNHCCPQSQMTPHRHACSAEHQHRVEERTPNDLTPTLAPIPAWSPTTAVRNPKGHRTGMTEVLSTSHGHGHTSWTGASAILFDLDGVLTPTAVVHERAWQELF